MKQENDELMEESSSKLSEEIDEGQYGIRENNEDQYHDICSDCIYNDTDCPGGMWCIN